MSRVGKIAHLPHEIREQLNHRLMDGETGRDLVAWLNSLPETQEVTRALFDGRPISEQNLTEWKQGGYLEWTSHQEALLYTKVLSEDAREIAAAAAGRSVTDSAADHLATLITSKLTMAIARMDILSDAEILKTVRLLERLVQQVHRLRMGDHRAARLRLTQAQITIEGAQAEKEMFKNLREWFTQGDGWRLIHGNKESSFEERLAQFHRLLTGEDPVFPPDYKSPGQEPSANDQTQ